MGEKQSLKMKYQNLFIVNDNCMVLVWRSLKVVFLFHYRLF